MTNVERLATQDVALRAAAMVRAGWCQGVSRTTVDDQVCYCVVGALTYASAEVYPINSRITDIIDNACNEVGGSLIQWNDSPERTQAEVVALLERVASQFNPPGWQSLEV
jgi:hypothetical protein